MLDEALLVSRSAGLDAKPRFKRCERAELPQPGLNDDNCDSREMRQPEPPVVDPSPAEPVSCEDNGKASHHEEHDSEVEEKNCIG